MKNPNKYKRTWKPLNAKPPTLKPLPAVVAQKIKPNAAIVITRPYTRRAKYYYYFHIGGIQK